MHGFNLKVVSHVVQTASHVQGNIEGKATFPRAFLLILRST